MTAVVRAAGGVVRRRQSGQDEVLLVHRPQYDDWTHQKGKLTGDETDEECALREVEEETGLRCRLRQELETVSYIDRRGPSIIASASASIRLRSYAVWRSWISCSLSSGSRISSAPIRSSQVGLGESSINDGER